MITIAQRIALVLATRLAQIKVVNGYETDAGLRVYRGRVITSSDDLEAGPVVVLYPRHNADTETPVEGLETKVRNELRLSVIGQAIPEDADHPLDLGFALMGDIKRALFQTLAPVIEAGERIGETPEYAGSRLALPEPGEQTVVAAVDVTVRYFETRGNPAAT